MIIFLYGDDTFRSRRKLNEMKDRFVREVDKTGGGLTVIDGSKADMKEINEAAAPSSLFSQKRMVVIENIFAQKSKTLMDELDVYLKQIKNQDNIIIFWDQISGEKMGKNKLFSTLAKEKFVQCFKSLSNTEATNWARSEIHARGAKITQQSAFLLTSLFGSDLWQLNNEINKLINYKRAKNQDLGLKEPEIIIENADIEELSRGNVDENIFALTDAISNKNKPKALELLEKEISAGVTDVYLLAMIVRQIKILMQVRQALDHGHSSRKIVSELKLHPFVVQKSMGQVRNFNFPILKNMLKELINSDMKLKTGQGDLKSELSLMIARM